MIEHNKSYVIAELPNAGMCNLLLVWSKAYVFSVLNNFPLYVHGWNKVRLGPWLRGEKSKRYYGKYFNRNTCYLKHNWNKLFYKHCIVEEPELEKVDNDISKIYSFKKVPNKNDYFRGLRQHRKLIKNGFFDMVKNEFIPPLTSEAITLGVHVRRGDFKIVQSSITPTSYFVNTIEQIRNKSSDPIPVLVISDGEKAELNEILKLPIVTLFQSGDDLKDLITLSCCKIIVPSRGSTYSLWAAFISEAEIILPDNHKNGRVRLESNYYSTVLFEGSLSEYLSNIRTEL